MSAHREPADHSRASWEIADPGASGTIDVKQSGVCNIVSAAAETRTLPRPTFVGQWMLLNLQTDGGTVTLTVTGGVNRTGNNTISLADVKNAVLLFAVRESATVLRWTGWAPMPESEAPSHSTV